MKGNLMKLSNKKIISAWLKNMSGVLPGGWNSRILEKETQRRYLTRILRRGVVVGTSVVQLQGKVVIYEHGNSQARKSDVLVDIYFSTI